MGFTEILALVTQLAPQLIGLLGQAKAASDANDQVALDAIHAQAMAMADALRPSGE